MSDPNLVVDLESTVSFVQPREVIESSFRALCAAGADPAEAQQGALAVLRAEVDSTEGLALLEKLLTADWTLPLHSADTVATSEDGVTVLQLACPDQPTLRSAIQLIDLAVSGTVTETRVVRSAVEGIWRPLWNDLLLRRSADVRRSIIVAITTGSVADSGAVTEYLTVRDGTVFSEMTPPNALLATITASSKSDNTIIVVLGNSEHAEFDASIPRIPLKVRTKDWQRLYQLSRSYLTVDQ